MSFTDIINPNVQKHIFCPYMDTYKNHVFAVFFGKSDLLIEKFQSLVLTQFTYCCQVWWKLEKDKWTTK